jgi:hypothetical protein
MNNINPGRRRRNGSNFFSPSSVLGIRNLAFDQPLARSRHPSRYANASGEPAELGLADLHQLFTGEYDLREPRPPALYRAGKSNASKIFVVRIFRMNNDTLNSMDQFKRAIIAIPQRLRRLAPAAIENGVRRRHARGGRRVLASHDPDEDVDRGSGVTSRQRTDFGEGFGHVGIFFIQVWPVPAHQVLILQCTIAFTSSIAAMPKGASIGSRSMNSSCEQKALVGLDPDRRFLL